MAYIATMESLAMITSHDQVPQASNTALAASEDVALDQAISLVVSTLFDEHSSKREVLLTRSMFLPVARVTLVPRDRPILASIIDVDEFFLIREKLFFGNGKWCEAFRVHDEGTTGDVRVHVNVYSVGSRSSLHRTADILFAVKAMAGRWVIRSCNVVFDEELNSKSPVTLVS